MVRIEETITTNRRIKYSPFQGKLGCFLLLYLQLWVHCVILSLSFKNPPLFLCWLSGKSKYKKVQCGEEIACETSVMLDFFDSYYDTYASSFALSISNLIRKASKLLNSSRSKPYSSVDSIWSFRASLKKLQKISVKKTHSSRKLLKVSPQHKVRLAVVWSKFLHKDDGLMKRKWWPEQSRKQMLLCRDSLDSFFPWLIDKYFGYPLGFKRCLCHEVSVCHCHFSSMGLVPLTINRLGNSIQTD